MNKSEKYKVVIIEPSPVIQQGFRAVIDKYPEFVVQNMYPDLKGYREDHSGSVPDIILMNPGVIHAHEQFSVKTHFPGKTVLAAILYKYVHHGLLADFDGMLDIYDDERTMMNRLLQIAKTNHAGATRNKDNNPGLSEREKEILTAVAKGMTNKEIADKYCISAHTAISHRKNITRKIGIKTVSGLTIYAILNNLLSPEGPI